MDRLENSVDDYIEALREEAIVAIIEARRTGAPGRLARRAERYKDRYRRALKNRCNIIARARRKMAEHALRALHESCDAIC